MGDKNPIRTLGAYSKPSYEGYKNNIELPEGNNVVLLRSDNIRLVQKGCSFHGFQSKDPNQHLKDFLKLVDSLDLDDPSPHGRILLLISLLNSFHRKGLKNFKMTSLCSNNIKESLSLKHGLVSRTYSKKSLIMTSIFGSKNAKESWALLEYLALYDKESWNDPRDFAKPVKEIYLPQNVPSTSDLVPTTLSTAWKIPSKLLLSMRPRVPTKRKASGLVSNFMASQDARLFKFEADFKQQQSEMTNKINTVLKAITNRVTGSLPSDTVKNPKLNVNSTSPVLPAHSYPTGDPQCSSHSPNSINAPEQTLEDEFKDLHLNLPVLEVLAHAPMYNAILDKCVESLELGKNRSAFIQGKMPKRMEDPGLFTLPCILEDSKPFVTLADLGSCVNIILLYLFKKLNIGLLKETNHVFGLEDGTKSYLVRIVRDGEVHIGRLKLLNDFYIIDMKKDPETHLLVGRGFLATANAVIDCRKAKIAVG
ncbi:MAK10-like protein [Tanacetum coccineum]